MSNVLPVSEQATIESLYKKGWSLRRIAGELGLNRRTVKRYAAKCTRPVTACVDAKCTTEVTPGSEGGERGEDSCRPSKPRSRCAEFAEVIAGKVEVGCSAQRIWQDLVEAHGFTSSYQSVKRFVRRWRKKQPARRSCVTIDAIEVFEGTDQAFGERGLAGAKPYARVVVFLVG
jgi:transposase